jgi:hypothetical protein
MGSPFYPHHHTELSSNILPRLPNATTYRRHDQFSCFYALWAGLPAPTTPEIASLRCQCTGPLSQVLQPEREWAPSSALTPLGLAHQCLYHHRQLHCVAQARCRTCSPAVSCHSPGYLTTSHQKWPGQLSFTCVPRSGSLTPQSLSIPPTSPSSFTRASSTALYRLGEGPTLPNGSTTACKGQG